MASDLDRELIILLVASNIANIYTVLDVSLHCYRYTTALRHQTLLWPSSGHLDLYTNTPSCDT